MPDITATSTGLSDPSPPLADELNRGEAKAVPLIDPFPAFAFAAVAGLIYPALAVIVTARQNATNWDYIAATTIPQIAIFTLSPFLSPSRSPVTKRQLLIGSLVLLGTNWIFEHLPAVESVIGRQFLDTLYATTQRETLMTIYTYLHRTLWDAVVVWLAWSVFSIRCVDGAETRQPIRPPETTSGIADQTSSTTTDRRDL